MALAPVVLSAYQKAMAEAQNIDAKVSQTLDTQTTSASTTATPTQGFAQMIVDSIKNVNNMQNSKNDMVEAFAAGKEQNVHELMINLQKAGMAMQMTTAVRGKVLEAYRELIKMQF